jgi:hypothetical protein
MIKLSRKTIKGNHGGPYPVQMGTQQEVSKLFNNAAVLIDLEKEDHIITKYDIIGSIK